MVTQEQETIITDRYTKTVLTVIAIALSVIAQRMGFSDAARAMGDGCGSSVFNA